MYSQIHKNDPNYGLLSSEVMTSLVPESEDRKLMISTSTRKSFKRLNTFKVMKELASKLVHQRTHRSRNNETTKTELTQYSIHESTYTLIGKTSMKKRKHNSTNQTPFRYTNIFEMMEGKAQFVGNKLNFHNKFKKTLKKRRKCYKSDQSESGKIKSLQKLLAGIRSDFESKEAIDALYRWSLKSTFRSTIIRRRDDKMEQRISPVTIVPPLPFPVWTKALEEKPQLVTLRRTESLSTLSNPQSFRSKWIMKGRTKNGYRKHRTCMIPAESLARALAPHKWNKGPRQVPVATFRATRIHYRYLLAKYGKSRLMGRKRVLPVANQPSIHSNFSVINLLHDVEEAISQNKYAKETDRIVKNFKEELNKDLVYAEPINGKLYKHSTINQNNIVTKRKVKLIKHSGTISFSGLLYTESENETDDSISINCISNYAELKSEMKSDILIENEQVKPEEKKNPEINPLIDSDSTDEIFKSFSSENLIMETRDEDIEISKFSSKKKAMIKEKKSMKKKKAFMREPKTEFLTEEERLNAIMQELQKQVKLSEPPTPLMLAKDDSLTELNFEKEPSTYISMTESSTMIDIANDETKQMEEDYTQQMEYTDTEPPQQDDQGEYSNLIRDKSLPVIKKKKSKREHSSTKSYTFRIDYESIKNKPLNIYNIVNAMDRVNKLLQNIPIQYDETTGQPYIVYDPKTIIKVIKEVNIKQEYRMIVKKYSKKTKSEYAETNTYHLSERNELEMKTTNPTKLKEDNFETVGNQLLQCIIKSKKTEIHSTENKHENESPSTITYKNPKHTKVFDNGDASDNNNSNTNPNSHNLYFVCNIPSIYKVPKHTELIDSPYALNLAFNNLFESSTPRPKTIGYLRKCSFLVKKIEINYQITGIYYQVITYMKRLEYCTHSTTQQNMECDTSTNETGYKTIDMDKNTHRICFKKHYRKDNDFSKKSINIPYDLIKKYWKELNNEYSRKHQTDTAEKYHKQYNKTQKYKVLQNEFSRKYGNKRNELAEKYQKTEEIKNNKICDISHSDQKDKNNKFEVNYQEDSNKSKKEETRQTITNTDLETKSCNAVPGNLMTVCDEYNKTNNISPVTLVQECQQCSKQSIGDYYVRKEQHKNNSFDLNTTVGFTNVKSSLPNQNDLLILNSINDEPEPPKNFSYGASFMTNILRSPSVKPMHNIDPMRKNMTKQVFYFQTTHNNIPEILKKQTSDDGYFLPFTDTIFSQFINYKESNKFQTYKKDVNKQVMESINMIKNELNENIDNICKLVNINKHLLIRFLKICLQQSDWRFNNTEKSIILEKEINELKLEIEEQFEKNMYPLMLIPQKDESLINIRNMITLKKTLQVNAENMVQLVPKQKDIKESSKKKKKLSLQILGFFHFLVLVLILMTIFLK